MVVSLGTLPLEGVVAERIEELHKILLNGRAQTNDKLSEENTQLLELSKALFNRAPAAYLNNNAPDSMLEVARVAARTYRDFLAGSAPFLVRIETRQVEGSSRAVTVIAAAIDDRPFIVDTLDELLREHSFEAKVYLHPILQEKSGRHISLNYLELDHIEDPARRSTLVEDITKAFEELVLVTDDYQEMLARCVETETAFRESGQEETALFLDWLRTDGFVLFGYRVWEGDASGKSLSLEKNDLGLFRSDDGFIKERLSDIHHDAEAILSSEEIIQFSKVLLRTRVHRPARLDLVTAKTVDTRSGAVKVHNFLGLLTSKSATQEGSNIPLIREKIQHFLATQGFLPNSHDYKEIVSIANSIPKADLLRLNADALREEIYLVFDLQRRNETRIRISLDHFQRFFNVSIVLPRDRFSGSARNVIKELIEKELRAEPGTAESQISVTDYPLVAIRLLVPNHSREAIRPDMAALEQTISELTMSWDDKLARALRVRSNDTSEHNLLSFYTKAFSEAYKASNTPEAAVIDIEKLEPLSVDSPLDLSINPAPIPGEEGLYRLRLYKRGESLTLSAILPFLENLGFSIVSETATPVATEGSVWAAIYDFFVLPPSDAALEEERVSEVLLPGLRQVLQGHAENDSLNQLLISPGLSCPKIAILRALVQYLWQIKATASQSTLNDALVKNPELADLLIRYFDTKFDPDAFQDQREQRKQELEKIAKAYRKALKDVSQITHDRALHSLLDVIAATLRTNAFQHEATQPIALKIDCKKIAKMPAPRPLYEIFVSSPELEGVHLRGGLVARGGLRWSERADDYRTEVLGLMKTQMVKNSIIIPVGAKGGFVVKNLPTEANAIREEVERCYRIFIRSLLEVTDNRKDDQIIPPRRCVVYDEPDPYFVVAADRGTATFSDVANSIAEKEFDFWLGDAFASGGSAGYDHKKYGITARGAWEAVCRHFREIGIDIDTQTFSVVGIGDMSGDVFGNGLLLSKNAKLLAAFNHKHIFLDPNPDPETSFKERQRLFELPRSGWNDYDPSLISKGGGVYERTLKEIELSEEAQTALGGTASSLSGEELVKAILCSPADLLWNGGIGTYVKAYEETHLDVGDRANDDVRCDARELRVRVIGEGGNLGLTQLARIEYSRIGGRCNTDAVDNSGGVDLSDLEVNMKILLREPVRRGELSLEERNDLLMSCVNEACEKVVSRNRTQTKGLSLAVRRSRINIGYYRGLIDSLEAEGLLDREKEFLPDDETLQKRTSMKAGLTRPELAVLIAFTKMSLYQTILESSLPEEPFLQQYLYAYFPKTIAERFSKDVARHPLRREIIATQVANVLVERMGGSFVYRSAEETGSPKTEIIRGFLAADAILSANEISEQLSIIDRANATRTHLLTLLRIQTAIDSMTRWFLEHRNPNLTLLEVVEKYSEPFRRLIGETESLITEHEKNRFLEATRQLISHDVPEKLAVAVSSVSYATAYLDIVNIATAITTEVIPVAHLYSRLAIALQVRQLLEQANDIEPNDRWEALALRTISADVRRSVAKLTKAIVEQKGQASEAAMKEFLEERKETVNRYRGSIQDFNNRQITIPALLVISNQLFALSRND